MLWANIVEEEDKRIPVRKASIFLDHDISKICNVGLKF